MTPLPCSSNVPPRPPDLAPSALRERPTVLPRVLLPALLQMLGESKGESRGAALALAQGMAGVVGAAVLVESAERAKATAKQLEALRRAVGLY